MRQVGLVDQLVPEAELLPAAEAAMRGALAHPDAGRTLVKARPPLRGRRPAAPCVRHARAPTRPADRRTSWWLLLLEHMRHCAACGCRLPALSTHHESCVQGPGSCMKAAAGPPTGARLALWRVRLCAPAERISYAHAQARLRDNFSREWEAYPAVEAPGAWAQLEDPGTVKTLGGVLQRLSGGGKRAKL